MNERRAGAVVDGAGRVASAYTAPPPAAAQPTRLSIIHADHRKETACGRFHIDLSVNHTTRLVGSVAHRAAPANAMDRDHAGHRGHQPRLGALGRLLPLAGADGARRRCADAGRHQPAERRRLYGARRRDRRSRGTPAGDGQRLAHDARGQAGDHRRDRANACRRAAARASRRLAHRRHRRSHRSPPLGHTWAAGGRLRTRRSAS